jgi:murein DD-endopeptidase MepM/ murein hydrolase activator NlpD
LKKYTLVSLALLLVLYFPIGYATAQTEPPPGPVYVVQQGDTLSSIALRFGVSPDDLQSYNHIANANKLQPGMELVIPGLEGIRGVLVTQTISYGENLRSLSRRYQVPDEALIQLNRLSSPVELSSISSLVIPQDNASADFDRRFVLAAGQSALELAVIQGVNPWTLIHRNYLAGTWAVLPGDVLHLPDPNADDGPGALPGEIRSVRIDPFPLVQGETTVIRLGVNGNLTPDGALIGHQLHFFKDIDGSYVALQGVHALIRPGIYPLLVGGVLENGARFAFSQAVPVIDGGYAYDPSLTVKPETIDPANTQPEDQEWNAVPVTATVDKLWDGVFQFPASPLYANCYPSYFGNRRSYNGGPYNYFHTGLDICGGVGAEVLAPAPGTVVFTGTLTVRGNALLLNHGWGIYTGYEHLSEILVKVGERVETGQLIGRVGRTGRVTGPHLHWEIWAGGVQVQPLDWLERAYP